MSEDRGRLRSLVLEHLADHAKLPKGRYDEKALLDCYRDSESKDPTLVSFEQWLSNQELVYAQNKAAEKEGNIETLVLSLLRRKVA